MHIIESNIFHSQYTLAISELLDLNDNNQITTILIGGE